MNSHRNKNRSARFLARSKGVKGLLAAPALLFAAGMFSAGVPAANAADVSLYSSVTSGDYSADNLSVAAGTIEFGGDAFAEISGTTTLASESQFTISSSGTPLDFGDVRFDSAATASESITVSASGVVFSSVLATSEGRLYVSEGADLLVSGGLSLAQATVSGTLTLNGVATVKGLVVSETSGRVVGDVTVSGASSALPISIDGRIEGDLSVVNSVSSLSHTIRGVVTGDVSADSGRIDLVGGTIGGDVNLSQGGGIELSDGASVAGTISQHSSGIVTLNEGTSAGGLSVDTATAYVYGATIDGTLRATGGSLIFLEDRNGHQLTVTGPVEIVNTDSSSLTGLSVQGDAEFGGDITLSGSVSVVMVDGFVSVAGTTRISDGARLRITRLRSAEGDPAPELGRVEVSGGGADGTVHFTQDVGATEEIVAKDAASLTIGGGTVGALFAENACEINFSGGEIGVVDVFDGVDFNQTGGRVREVILGDGARYTLSGGEADSIETLGPVSGVYISGDEEVNVGTVAIKNGSALIMNNENAVIGTLSVSSDSMRTTMVDIYKGNVSHFVLEGAAAMIVLGMDCTVESITFNGRGQVWGEIAPTRPDTGLSRDITVTGDVSGTGITVLAKNLTIEGDVRGTVRTLFAEETLTLAGNVEFEADPLSTFGRLQANRILVTGTAKFRSSDIDNTNAGYRVQSANALEIAEGGSVDLTLDTDVSTLPEITVDGSLRFSSADAIAFDFVSGGSGTVTKSGAGTLSIAATPFTGTLRIEEGDSVLASPFGGNVSVAAGTFTVQDGASIAGTFSAARGTTTEIGDRVSASRLSVGGISEAPAAPSASTAAFFASASSSGTAKIVHDVYSLDSSDVIEVTGTGADLRFATAVVRTDLSVVVDGDVSVGSSRATASPSVTARWKSKAPDSSTPTRRFLPTAGPSCFLRTSGRRPRGSAARCSTRISARSPERSSRFPEKRTLRGRFPGSRPGRRRRLSTISVRCT